MEQQVKIRKQRQSILGQAGAPELTFVLSESALRRTVDSSGTMSEQLRRLADIPTTFPHVSLQVLPFAARSYIVASFAFTILRFGDATSDVIYTESFTTADNLDRPEAVRAYSRLWDDLRAAALGPVESGLLISQVAYDFEKSGPEQLSKSSRSDGNGGQCVEVADNVPGIVAVRDSEDPAGPALVFGPAQWTAFIGGVTGGEFDL